MDQLRKFWQRDLLAINIKLFQLICFFLMMENALILALNCTFICILLGYHTKDSDLN
jgi:hypothetical protein